MVGIMSGLTVTPRVLDGHILSMRLFDIAYAIDLAKAETLWAQHAAGRTSRLRLSAGRDGQLDMIDRLEHQPTLPSSEIATSFWASTANSMGSSWRTSLTKPLTNSCTASSCVRPRCMA